MEAAASLDVPALTKGLSLFVGALVLICAIVFMASDGSYLAVVVGLETMTFALIQLMIEVQAPEGFLEKIRASAPLLLTAPAQVFVSVLTALFLFAMGTFGVVMGVLVLLTVAANAYTLSAYPDAMPARYGGLPDSDLDSAGPYGGHQGLHPPSAYPPQQAPAGGQGPYGGSPDFPGANPSGGGTVAPQAPSTADL